MSSESSSDRHSSTEGSGSRHPAPEAVRPFLECEQSSESIRIIAELSDAGFVAYLAGGCVRDALLDRMPKDYDVATNATPTSVRELFGHKRTLSFGASFGVIGVLPKKSSQQQSRDAVLPTEVATFRSDGEYSDGRRPDSVHYGTAEQDALRRDFTINGMFYDPLEHCVIDYVGGQDDLSRKVLHTIGDSHQRFDEDKLRMLRAVRFATTLGFTLTAQTRQAIIEHADTISVVSGERIGAEMRRILQAPHAIDGIRLLADCELDRHVLPEWEAADHDRAASLLANLSVRSFSAAVACLLLAAPGASLSHIANRWKLSGEEQREVSAAVKHYRVIIDADQLPWSNVQPILIGRDIGVVTTVAEAVARSDGDEMSGLDKTRDALTWSREELNPTPLLTGNDLAQLGFEPGPAFAGILKSVRDAQLNGQATTRADAEQIARELA